MTYESVNWINESRWKALFSSKTPDGGLGRDSMTSPRLHISHHSPGIVGWWISNPFLWSTYCIPSMVEGITQMSSPWAPTISPRLRAMSPFYRRGKSDSGAVRRPTEARLACWWWSPDSNLGLPFYRRWLPRLTLSIHTLGPLSIARPPLCQREDLCDVLCPWRQTKRIPYNSLLAFQVLLYGFFGENASRGLSPLVK